MVGNVVGELPVVEFIEFLPMVRDAKTPTVDFSKVPQRRKEKMYGPFVRR